MKVRSLTGSTRSALRLLTLFAMISMARVEALGIAQRPLRDRCRWRQRWCRRILHALQIPLHVSGELPCEGMLVSNHLTYLDILTLGAVFDGVIVSKREVLGWPLLGPITRAAGTVYVDRDSTRSAAEATLAVARLLKEDVPVLVFPEGTTSDGERVLPFQAPLFQAAVRSGAEIWPAAIRYRANEDLEAIPYWGNMTLVPHLARVMRIGGLSASIAISGLPLEAKDRRIAAASSQAATERLYAEALCHKTAPHVRLRSARAAEFPDVAANGAR